MIRTLKISFSLKNTYRVNGILHSLKQIPLLKKLLPDALYGIWGLKVFANVFSLLGEACTIFFGKFLYFLIMVWGAGMLYDRVDTGQAFLHILFFLTIITISFHFLSIYKRFLIPCFSCVTLFSCNIISAKVCTRWKNRNT